MTDSVTVTIYTGDDGATVVQIDTTEGVGVLRVNVNDGRVWQGDPEQGDTYVKGDWPSDDNDVPGIFG